MEWWAGAVTASSDSQVTQITQRESTYRLGAVRSVPPTRARGQQRKTSSPSLTESMLPPIATGHDHLRLNARYDFDEQLELEWIGVDVMDLGTDDDGLRAAGWMVSVSGAVPASTDLHQDSGELTRGQDGWDAVRSAGRACRARS